MYQWEAALCVLYEHDFDKNEIDRGMHYTDITEVAIKRGYLSSYAENPAQNIGSDLRRKNNIFKSYGNGFYEFSDLENAKKVYERIRKKFPDCFEEPESACNIIPEEVENENDYFEGITRKIMINTFERDPEARKDCIRHYGSKCFICGFDFEEKYGVIGKGYIHVHHIVPLSDIREEYQIDPIKDLRPVCPNCHAIIHTEKPPIDIDRLKSLILK